ncbi:hypothetical protein [Paenibacillus sp. y28]|uniref:hypothetical protein n=1 Tax=Paenibacillus sp. y28 TaxID=3129110 RepID=UPI0030161AF2
MRQGTRKKLIKWGIGAGCTLSLALLFQQAKSDPAFASAVQQAAGSSALNNKSQASAPDNGGMNEFDRTRPAEGRGKRYTARSGSSSELPGNGTPGQSYGRSGQSQDSSSGMTPPSVSQKPTGKTRGS